MLIDYPRGPVAQLDRASVFGTEGWGFEPLRGRHSRVPYSSFRGKIHLRFFGMKHIFHFRAAPSQLGPLEKSLLNMVWEKGSATVRELVESDGVCRYLAYTTVMTTLDRLFNKKLLTRQSEGRAFRYTPRVTREELHREVAGEAFRQLLNVSPAPSLPLS